MKNGKFRSRPMLQGFGVAILLATPLIGRAAPAENKFLDASIESFEVPAGLNPLSKLCPAINAACGAEVNFDDLPEETTSQLVLTKTSPRKVLDEVVRRHPNYRWVVRDGVINLEPRIANADDYLSKKLDVVSIRGVSSLKAALDVLNQSGIPFGFQPAGRQGKYARINLELKNASVREVLNAIAKLDGQLLWTCSVSSERHWVTFQLNSWKKSGVQFSDEERLKVREWMNRRKAK